MATKLADAGQGGKIARPMDIALAEAERARDLGEEPIAAVVVSGTGEILGKAGNRTLAMRDPTAHAELLAIRAACDKRASERLTDCDLYVTLEPCAMCAGAVVLSRIDRLVFGAWDEKAGMVGSVGDIVRHPRLNHRAEVVAGVMAKECGEVLREFFGAMRNEN